MNPPFHSFRCFIVASIGLLSSLGVLSQNAPALAARPNILFCIADDWSWPHAGVYGDKVVRTPNFDRVAREGALFTRAFCAAPSCTPSRAAMLTGQMPHRLREGGNLWGFLPKEFGVFPDSLEAAGYTIGLQGKGWGPGNFQGGGRTRNPAGPGFRSFTNFLESAAPDKPFFYWFGSSDPHRPYEPGTGAKAGLDPAKVEVPPYFPDTPVVRQDMLDYYFEVERFDRTVGEMIRQLESKGLLDKTIVIITSDNGMPFPRCKANLYDSGARMPLAVRWPALTRGPRRIEALVSLSDLAPTILDLTGLPPLAGMTGLSWKPLLEGKAQAREQVFFERERHANVRKGDLSYPARALRTDRFLYVRNLRPERWPGGDPEKWQAVGAFGDCDNSPTKDQVLAGQADESIFYRLAFAKRPAEELYDLAADPHQIKNVAGDPKYADEKNELAKQLDTWMRETGDPHSEGKGQLFDSYPYFGR